MPEREAIRKAILAGIHDANVLYEEWTGELWIVDSGVEGHVVSRIAERVHEATGEEMSLIMELTFAWIADGSGASPGPGRPRNTLNAAHHVDIALQDRAGRTVAVIEVKRGWGVLGVLGDLARVRDLILAYGQGKGGTLNAGFVGFMLAGAEAKGCSAEDNVVAQEQEVLEHLEDFPAEGLKITCTRGPIRHYPETYRAIHKTPDWAHASFCIELANT